MKKKTYKQLESELRMLKAQLPCTLKTAHDALKNAGVEWHKIELTPSSKQWALKIVGERKQ